MKKRGFKFALMFLAAIVGFGAITMLLWNWLIPGIFGISTINFWQALGLLVLCRILFSGMGGHGHRFAGGMRGGMHGRNHLHEKWMKMSPEEKKEFLKKREKWIFGRGRHFHSHGPFGHDHFDTRSYHDDIDLNNGEMHPDHENNPSNKEE